MAKNSRNGYGFGLGGPLPALFPTPIISIRVPATSDIGFELGTAWINTATNQVWHLTSVVAGSATWALSSPGASDVDTLTGDGGGAISPAAGNITLAGGTNLTTAGAGNTITFNMDAAITLATSVTSPIYTTGAGVDMNINAPAGQDVIIQMGDAAGANKVSFEDSTSAEVFAIDSNGGITTLTGLTLTGAFTQTAGAVSISEDNSANAVGIANGTTARVVDIASSAAAHIVSIGSATGAASLDLAAGTGNFTLEGGTATTYDISGTGANTGTITIGGGTGGQTISILNGINTGAQVLNLASGANAANSTVNILGGIATAGTQTLNLATGASATAINIGNADVLTSLSLDGGGAGITVTTSGTMTLDTTGGGDLDITSTGAMNLISTGDNSIDSTAGNVLLGSNAIDHSTSVGGTTGTSFLLLQSGSAGIEINATGAASPLLIDSVGVLELNSSAGVIGIGSDANAFAINIGTGAAARVITLGNVTGASQIVLNSGTAGVNINTTGAGDVVIDSDDTFLVDADGVLELNSSGGIISIGNDADAQNMNFGTGGAQRDIILGNVTGTTSVVVNIGTGAASFGASATDHTTTIGSTTGASPLILQGGTTDITLTGTVKEVTSEFTTRSGDSITFQQAPLIGTSLDTGGVPTGATGDDNILCFQEGIIMHQFVIGAGQTILKPVMVATGLVVSGDQTTLEGYEYNFGATIANSRHSFTIGTSPAFFLEWSFRVDDVSGLEPCLIGFRRTQANQAQGNLALYTDFVGYGLNDAVAGGDAVIQTQLNTGGINSTDTNDAWANAATHTLAVLVSAAGVVTFTFDGGAPTVTQAFTFDNGDVVHPFWRHEFNAGLPDVVQWISFKCGFQA